jgi:hypothetical protein
MDWWNRLDPNSRRMVMIGLPLVALAALVSALRTRDASPSSDEETPGTGLTTATPPPAAAVGGGYVYGGGGVINMGELGDTFSDWSAIIAGLPKQLEDAVSSDRPTTPATPPAPQGEYVTVGPKGETWKQLTQRHYGSTNPAGVVVRATQNAGLVRSHGSGYDVKLPGGARVFMPARNW